MPSASVFLYSCCHDFCCYYTIVWPKGILAKTLAKAFIVRSTLNIGNKKGVTSHTVHIGGAKVALPFANYVVRHFGATYDC